MKCAHCMTVKLNGNSTVCEFHSFGQACGSCFNVGTTRCSFELNPVEVAQMVSEILLISSFL